MVISFGDILIVLLVLFVLGNYFEFVKKYFLNFLSQANFERKFVIGTAKR